MMALVVGYGHMGAFHRRALRALGYWVDTVDPRASSGASYGSTREALLENTYDVAVVAVPAPLLVECAFELAGTPHLYIEKPFAPTTREIAMLGSYLEARGPVCVGYVERFNPVVMDLRERLSPEYGLSPHVRAVRFARWSDRPSNDPVSDLLTHDVDLATHLLTGHWDEKCIDLCSFDVRTEHPLKRRTIELDVAVPSHANGGLVDATWKVDLMNHDTDANPLIALWHAFTMGLEVPRPKDALLALAGAQAVAERDRVAA